MQTVGTWVNWERTCDTFKAGDPEREIHKIGVAWMSSMAALELAHSRGCDMFVTHEPTFYAHMDDNPDAFRFENARKKKTFLEKTGMVVYRCHDVWDLVPEIGITGSWASGLGLSGPIASRPYYAVYPVGPMHAGDLAETILSKIRPLGQESVSIIGSRGNVVSRLGIGTGAGTDVVTLYEMGADIILATEDGMSFWRDGMWAKDMEINVIIVNHAVSEIWGMESLARYLRQTFPQVEVEFLNVPYAPRTIK
ncbi:MAG: Nif3-like dinuclear metal center hexameric protein [Armatimonadetes bacterium]|nr:Nif3-like dinuclear metal center hexameric protein [Armatimonadota bacterium]